MAVSVPVDLAKIVANSTGTGAITLGAAASGFRGIEALTNGQLYSYTIQQGDEYETGRGTYLSATQQLTRSPIWSSNGNAPIDLQSNALVAFVVLAEDLDSVTLTAQATQAAADAIAAQEQTGADAAQTSQDRAAVEAASQNVAISASVYPNAYASILPQGVTSIAIGGTAITGATPGTYPLTFAGGSIVGMVASLVVDSATTAHIVIANTGLGSGTTPPTVTKPAGANLPSGTTLTAVVSSLISVTGTYWTATADSAYLALWSNTGTVSPVAVLNPDSTQITTPAKSALSALSQNILLDPYNELVASNPYLDGFDHFNGSAPLWAASGPNSGVKTPVLIGASGVTISRLFDGNRIPLLVGQTLFLESLAWTDGTATVSLSVNFYNASNAAIGSTVTFNNATTGASIKSISGNLAVPTGAVKLSLRVIGNCAKEAIGFFASYVGAPKHTYPGLPPAYAASSEVVANLTSDPLLQDNGAAGYTYNGTRVLVDADNPYGGGSCGQTTATALQIYIDMTTLPLKVGDTITWRALANFAAGSTGNVVGLSFINSAGTSLGDVNVETSGAGTTTGTVDLMRSAVIPAGTVKLRLVAAGSGARKLMTWAISEGASKPNFARGASAASMGGESGAVRTPKVVLPSADAPVLSDWNVMLVYGQSLGAGANAYPALSVTQPFSNLTFIGGPRSGAELGGSTSASGPLIEVASASDGETICSAMCNRAVELAYTEDGKPPANLVFFAANGSRSSQTVAQLSKGNATGYYAALMAQITAVKTLADAAGKTCSIVGVAYMQGEADVGVSTYSQYYAALKQLRSDIETDAHGIMPRTGAVPMLLYQTLIGSLLVYNSGQGGQIQQAQIDLCKQEPRFHFVTPMWNAPESTTGNEFVHISNIGEMWTGALFGRPLYNLVTGYKPQALVPMGAIAHAQTVRIKFAVPVKPLVIDTANLVAVQASGVAIADDSGTLTISKMAVSAEGDELVCTVNRALSTNPVARIGKDYARPSENRTYAGSNNLRDSNPEVMTFSGTDYPLWALCPAVTLPIYPLG